MKPLVPRQSVPIDRVRVRLNQTVRLIAADPVAGLASARKLAAELADVPVAHRVAALAARRNGREAEAQEGELRAIGLSLGLPALQSAQSAILEGRLGDAEPLVRAHLRQDPEDPAAALLLGEIAARSGSLPQAENLFRRAFLLAPAYSEARLALAKLQRDGGRYDQALETLDALLARQPDHLSALALRAAIYVQQRRFEEADAAFGELHAQHPGDARGWANHAFMLKTVGRQSDAVVAYRRALEIDPANAQAWWGLANLKTVRFTPADIAAMRSALESPNQSNDDRINVFYSLGKAYDDLGDIDAAFAALRDGATLRLAQVPYDPDKVDEHVRSSRKIFTRAFFDARTGWGSAHPDPIFIISLPRSGSTLVEQILASHPLIEGTEELHDIERMAVSLNLRAGVDGWLEALPTLSRDRIRELGDHYLNATRRFRFSDRPFFTDKMPSNWVYTGLIHTILPRAKIIDVRRHPLGCGLANFSQHFSWGINFSYDLAHIGRFYQAYVRQMAHFSTVLPGCIHHLTYEALVENTEAEVRRLLDYLGLPFDEACLRFFENPRAVHTPSSEQVRQPINREGVERWQRYDKWLGPLKQALGPVLDYYPDVPLFHHDP